MNYCKKFNDLPLEIKDKIPKAPLFFSREYENNVISRGQGMIYIWSETRIIAARIRKQLFLKAALLESEPFIYSDQGTETEKSFLNGAMATLKKLGIQWTLTTNTARFQDYPDNAKTVLSGNHIMDLTLSEEELWANMHSKHRNTVRRGEKGEMNLKFGGLELVEEYTPIANETYARSQKSGSTADYYKSVIDKLEDNSLMAIICKEGEIQAGGMFLFSPAIAYYLHGASISRPEPGSTNYLLWQSIMKFKEMGVREFSFVGYHVDAEPGSKLDNIQKFKERFGGRLESCYSFRYVQKPFFYKLYCFAMQCLAKKPFAAYKDTIDEQIDKYPELNRKAEA